MATYRLEFGHLGEGRPVPDLTVETGDINALSRTVVEYARPHITPVLTGMGRPELADAMFRMNGDRTMGEFLHLDLAAGKGVAFLAVRITTTPARVQRTRPRVKGQPGMPPGALYVGRGTRWGNPFIVGTDANDRTHATALYREWLENNTYEVHPPNSSSEHRQAMDDRRDWIITHAVELRGRDLACWCAPPDEGQTDHCHAAVLIQLSNAPKENPTP